MNRRYTSAHWGTYEITDTPDGPVLKSVSDDPSPSSIGNGWVDASRDTRTRVLKPAIRKSWLASRDRGKRCSNDSFVEVDWDTALDLVAGELKRVRADHGNEAIYAGSYGWASAGRFHHAQSQMRRFLNLIGGYTYSRETYSHAAAEVLFPHITGLTNSQLQAQMTDLQTISEHTELLVAFGGISGRTAQIASSGVARHETEHWLSKAHERGMKAINVSPIKGDYAAENAPEWIPLRPNTDTALMLGIAHEWHRRGLHNEAFLHRFCNGWPKFEAYLTGAKDGQPKDAAWAAKICDIAPEAIRELACRMSTHTTMIALTWGMQRADHGEQTLWMGLTLAAMLGQIGTPGGGFGFGYGSTDVVGKRSHRIPWPAVPQGQNPVDSFIPVARIADMLLHPGQQYQYNGETRTYPDTRLVYWVGGNPYHHHQDLMRLEHAWCQPETVITHEPWWTATAKRADIVLPSTTPLERCDLMTNGRENGLVWMSKVMAPLGEARDDHAIFADLAKRFDVQDAFTEGRSTDDWIEWLWTEGEKAAKASGHDMPTFEDFKAEGRLTLPASVDRRILFSDFIADPTGAPLPTETGKIEIVCPPIARMGLPDCAGHPTWITPTEWTGNAAPQDLHLISGQPGTKLHSQLDSGSHAATRKRKGREIATLHPDTAAARGIEEGDFICLKNARGACLASAEVSDGIRSDAIALATGAWFDPQLINGTWTCVHGNPNILTLDKGTSSLAQGNIAHTTLVTVEKWEGELPEVKAFEAPEVTSNL
ncbi:MAG: molybdopterin-dependent oxidoreductase [Silicimonas sp.]|nr:molybdopterin-dependent oxidoreductase [Silicimonas sp.]